MNGSTGKTRLGVTLLAVVAAAAAPTPAPAAVPVDAVAARICGDIFARLGFERFQSRFGAPEDCAPQVAAAAAEGVAACADAADTDACLRRRVRLIVEQYTDEERSSGAVYTTRSGAHVRVVSFERSGVTESERLEWAEFLDSLPHGSELASVTLQLGTATDVRDACGPSALACYLPPTQTIVVSSAGEQALAARSLVAHEYGHHLANNRLNLPWSALDRGTKRWATHLRICERVRSQELAARALWGPGYRLFPAEGFAEAYRILSERRLGLAEAPWLLVDRRFYPDAEALRLLEQDVLDPWLGPTTFTLAGRGSRTFRIATPLDGAVRVTVSTAAGSAYRVSAPTSVCGQRSIAVRVQRLRGHAPFQLTVSRP